MINDWKKKIDKFKKQEEIRLAEEKEKSKIAREKAELEAHLKQIEHFHCHICNVRAQKPGTQSGLDDEGSTRFWDDWSLPGDLWKCELCFRWTCAEHFSNGICQECAEKLS